MANRTQWLISKIPYLRNRYFKIRVLIKRRIQSESISTNALMYLEDRAAVLSSQREGISYLYLMNEKDKIKLPDSVKAGITARGERILELYSAKKGEYSFMANELNDDPLVTSKAYISEELRLWGSSLRDKIRNTYKKWSILEEYKPVIYSFVIMLGFGLAMFFFWNYGLSQGAELVSKMINMAGQGIPVNLNITYSCTGNSCQLLNPIIPSP